MTEPYCGRERLQQSERYFELFVKAQGGQEMDKNAYNMAAGFVVNYKTPCEPLLFNELHGRIAGLELLERGNSAAVFGLKGFGTAAEETHREDFVFLQHIHPFMSMGEIQGDASDLPQFLNMLQELTGYVEEGDVLVCQCRIVAERELSYSNGSLTESMASFLEGAGYTVSVREADTVISLTVFDRFAYMGISRAEDNVSRRAGGVLFYSHPESMICRAECKIEEAFEVFGIQAGEGKRALDLGAAPGGWTHYLSKRGVSVDAVDPAALDERVLRQPNVRHFRMTAQEFSRTHERDAYDLIVNDMRMDTNQSIDILCDMSRLLKEDGSCLMTLKLSGQGIQKRINVARKVLSGRFKAVRIRQLYYNRSEVTVYVRNKL